MSTRKLLLSNIEGDYTNMPRRGFTVQSGTSVLGANIWITNTVTNQTAHGNITGEESESICANELAKVASQVGLNAVANGVYVEMDANISETVQGFVFQDAQIPNVSGTWKRPGDNWVMTIQQQVGVITSNFASTDFTHSLTGLFNGSEFPYEITRRTIKGGCTTKLTGSLNLEGASLHTRLNWTDGACDLKNPISEDSTWTKQ